MTNNSDIAQDAVKTVYPESDEAPPWRLEIIKGYERGRTIPLDASRNYAIGRKDCDITIHENDKRASRRHAILCVQKNKLVIENLSQTTGTLVNGKKVDKIRLQHDDNIAVGETLFAVEHNKSDFGFSPLNLKQIGIGAGVILIIIISLFALLNDNQPQPEDKQPGPTTPPPRQSLTPTLTPTPTPDRETRSVLQENIAKAQKHFNDGQFFYNAGRFKKALEDWWQTIKLNPHHKTVGYQIKKAESELDLKIERYYRQAMSYKDQKRFEEAKQKFKSVIRLCFKNSDERCQNSQKELDQLRNR